MIRSCSRFDTIRACDRRRRRDRRTDGIGVAYTLLNIRGVATGGIWVYIPQKLVQVDFLWGVKNDVKTAIEHEY